MHLLVTVVAEQHQIAFVGDQVLKAGVWQHVVQFHRIEVELASAVRAPTVVLFVEPLLCLPNQFAVVSLSAVTADMSLLHAAVADGEVQPQHLERLLERPVGLDLSEKLIGGGRICYHCLHIALIRLIREIRGSKNQAFRNFS